MCRSVLPFDSDSTHAAGVDLLSTVCGRNRAASLWHGRAAIVWRAWAPVVSIAIFFAYAVAWCRREFRKLVKASSQLAHVDDAGATIRPLLPTYARRGGGVRARRLH